MTPRILTEAGGAIFAQRWLRATHKKARNNILMRSDR